MNKNAEDLIYFRIFNEKDEVLFRITYSVNADLINDNNLLLFKQISTINIEKEFIVDLELLTTLHMNNMNNNNNLLISANNNFLASLVYYFFLPDKRIIVFSSKNKFKISNIKKFFSEIAETIFLFELSSYKIDNYYRIFGNNFEKIISIYERYIKINP